MDNSIYMTVEQPELIYVGRSQKSDSFSWEEGTDGPRGYGSFLGVTDGFYIMIWGMVTWKELSACVLAIIFALYA